MTHPKARRREQVELAASLRQAGRHRTAIARELRTRYGQNGLAAMRLAHGWSQQDAADAWNHRWPDSPRTFKNFSYWENWPGPTGHAPSLAVLDGLAQLYMCSVADLLGEWGDHRNHGESDRSTEPDALAWQVRNLDLAELVHAVSVWSQQVPGDRRRADLLKLSTAVAVAATDEPVHSSSTPRITSALVSGLAGEWVSTYSYASTSRAATFLGTHSVDLRPEDGRIVGRSHPEDSGSELTLSLSVDGTLVTGSWQEHTSPQGHYRAAVYSGLLQLVIDPTVMSMTGRWLGISKQHTIKSGEWRLERVLHDTESDRPDTTTTTVEPANSPAATIR